MFDGIGLFAINGIDCVLSGEFVQKGEKIWIWELYNLFKEIKIIFYVLLWK